MTIPYERTRAVIQVREFLIELCADSSIPEKKRQAAWFLLRHYPSRDEVLMAGKIEEMLAPESLFMPVFSSTDSDS